MDRFDLRNVRAVLPDGGDPLWDGLVASFLARRPPVWEFFPSQVRAIESGLLTSDASFALEMPTGAGKTALCETLLYYHAQATPGSLGVLLVPYRSLASELRRTMVRRLSSLGLRSACMYGGTVPTQGEATDLVDVSMLVATPESLSGLLGADPGLYQRVSLLICDEGHLLDRDSRGIALELLLARMRSRASGPPRFVFISAIVPNAHEINAWLGGSDETVVTSDYRPAIAEFAHLRAHVDTRDVDLVVHPEAAAPVRFELSGFLGRNDFTWLDPRNQRRRSYPSRTIKATAIATARKFMNLGAVAVFATTKGGDQGVTGLAAELIEQLRLGVALPAPSEFADPQQLEPAIEYLAREYGDPWVGTITLRNGAVLHYGDLPPGDSRGARATGPRRCRQAGHLHQHTGGGCEPPNPHPCPVQRQQAQE